MMNKNITEFAKARHTSKAYDAGKKISDDDIEKVKELLRFSPSSTNSQPWHFIIASTDEGKKRITKATDALYPFNSPSILNASHVIVFCSRVDMKEDYLQKLLNIEEEDGRFATDPEALKERQHMVRNLFFGIHKYDFKDAQHWMDKQVYLNLGAFLLGVSTMGIDATPMEGVDTKALDEEFGLREKGYTSLVVVPIGYRDEEKDFNARLPKSRLPYSEILTEI